MVVHIGSAALGFYCRDSLLEARLSELRLPKVARSCMYFKDSRIIYCQDVDLLHRIGSK